MNQFKTDWKKLWNDVRRSKRLYIAVTACVGIVAISMLFLSGQSGDKTLTVAPTASPTAAPTTSSVPLTRPSPTSPATASPATRPDPDAWESAPAVAANAGIAATESPDAAPPDALQMPVVGDVAVPFSMNELVKSKTTGTWQVHRGVDIKSPLSAAVLAAADGVVARAYRDDLYGDTIVLSHGGGVQTTYANLSTLDMVKEGQTVSAGQAISGVGDTATVELLEEAHLHFEVTVDGVAKNPTDFFR